MLKPFFFLSLSQAERGWGLGGRGRECCALECKSGQLCINLIQISRPPYFYATRLFETTTRPPSIWPGILQLYLPPSPPPHLALLSPPHPPPPPIICHPSPPPFPRRHVIKNTKCLGGFPFLYTYTTSRSRAQPKLYALDRLQLPILETF